MRLGEHRVERLLDVLLEAEVGHDDADALAARAARRRAPAALLAEPPVGLEQYELVGQLVELGARCAGLDQSLDRLAVVEHRVDRAPESAGSLPSASQPLRPGTTISVSPPTGVPRIGRLWSSASRATFGQHSHSEGITTTSCRSMNAPTSVARDGVGDLDPLVLADHQLELRAQRGPERAGVGVAAEHRQVPVLAVGGGQRAQQVLDALAALHPPEVEEPHRAAGGQRRALARARVLVLALAQEGVGDLHPRGEALRAVEAPVGLEHVAAGPQQAVGVAQRVALAVEERLRREVVGDAAVEDRADLGARVKADRDERVAQPRRLGVARLNGDEALAEVVAELDQVRSAVAVDLAQARVRARAVGVHVAEARAPGLVVRLLHVLDAHALRDQPRVAFAAHPLVGLAMAGAREHEHLGDLRQRARRRGDDRRDAAADVGIDLARDESDAHRGHGNEQPALRPPQAASCHPLGVRSRIQVSPERYHQIARAALALLTLIVFTGAAVRLTGSGLGCPDWPKCTDDRLVSELDTHGLIEFVNRVFSGLVALIAVAAGVLAYFRTPFRRDLMLLGLLLPLGVLGQGVLGGLTVIYDLRPGFVMSHFGLSMLILVAAWALHWRSRPAFEDERAAAQASPPDRATLWAARLMTPIGALTVFAGTAATASGPHAGGAGTGDVVVRLDVKGSGTLDWAIHQHGYVASTLGAVALIALTLALLRRAGRELVTALGVVLGLLVVQGAVGADPVRARAARRDRLGPRLPGDVHVGRDPLDVECRRAPGERARARRHRRTGRRGRRLRPLAAEGR